MSKASNSDVWPDAFTAPTRGAGGRKLDECSLERDTSVEAKTLQVGDT